jgi:glutamate synthase (NADPH/NADH) large chain
MTGGTVVSLGAVGDNFGAGFTGGMAFVYDPDDMFKRRINGETLTWQRLGSGHWEGVLTALIGEHARETGSRYAAIMLHDWETERGKFWQIVPKEFVRYLEVPLVEAEALRA